MIIRHPEYYPRFGYQTQAFGVARCEVEMAALPPALMDLWDREEGAVDFSLRPDAELLDWLSPNPQVATTVYIAHGVLSGYSRVHQAAPAVRTFGPALAAELVPGILSGYRAEVRAGQREPGRPLWPTAFDLV